MKKQYIIPIFVPHLGCPNDCVFCNQKSISGTLKNVTKKDVKETIEYYLKNFPKEDISVEVAFFGGSFTKIDTDLQIELLEAVNEYIENKKIDSIRISTRPDGINKDILKMLKKYHVKTIELGVQSSNDYILMKVHRGHTFKDVKNASKLIRKYGFVLGHQMMIGLPESTSLDEFKTAKDLAKLKPKIMRIYPVLVIKNTQLEKDYLNKEFEPITVEQAVERIKDLYKYLNKKHINIIRVGLQNTENITNPEDEKSQVVAGPYHPAFRQLIEDSIWYDAIVEKIKKYNVKVKEIEIRVNAENLNNIVGHKKENEIKLKNIYDVKIKVIQDDNIKPGKFEMKVLKTYLDFLNEE